MVRLDIRYARTTSFGRDMLIIAKTGFVVVGQLLDGLSIRLIKEDENAEPEAA